MTHENVGVHSPNCAAEHPNCQCMTCRHDNTACCVKHLKFGMLCPIESCPDYEEDEHDQNIP